MYMYIWNKQIENDIIYKSTTTVRKRILDIMDIWMNFALYNHLGNFANSSFYNT